MKNRLYLVLFLFMFSGWVFGQEMSLPELTGFKKQTNYPVFGPGNLWDFIDGAADNYLAYGFLDLHVAEYKKGKKVIKLEVYHHKNDILAFGIYSTERSPSFSFTGPGAQGYTTTDGSINFYKGDYYVKIRTYSKSEKVIRSAHVLAREVADMLPGNKDMPAELSLFPEEGKKTNEETYINESVLGHKFLNNAFRANYSVGPDNFSIYIIKTASHEEAKKTVESYLSAVGLEPSDAADGRYVISDGYNGTIFMVCKESTIVLISGLSKGQSDIADRYISQIIK
jgi:hypothetical protein